MKDRDRLEHLRVLLDRLEHMPASAERDWLLREVRARAVDVDSGIAPSAVRALPHDAANAEIAAAEAARVRALARPARPKPTLASPPRRPAAPAARIAPRVRPAAPTAPSSPPAQRERAGYENAVDLLKPGGLLSLDDPPADAAAPQPWARGLRG